MLAILPAVPYVTFLLRNGVPRFGLLGDLAILDHTTRHVWTGDALLGEPSRFSFNQPGPLFFYLAAPFQALFGTAATGIYVAAAFVNAAASATLVASARMFARRAHAIAALLVLLAWWTAFGSIGASPWPPFVVVLPLLAFLFNAAMLARGKSSAAYPAMVFGVFAAQTHVVALTTVPIVTLAALGAFAFSKRKPGSPDPSTERFRLLLATLIGGLLCTPPIVDQIIAPAGNFRLALGFFLDAPASSFGTAVHRWMTMAGWLPYRIARLALLHEGFVPELASRDELYLGTTTFPLIVAAVHVGAGVGAGIVAFRRRDTASLALIGLGAVGDLVAIASLRSVVGPCTPYLVLWTTAASSVLWMGVVSSFFSAVGERILKSPRVSNAVVTPLVVVFLATAVASASLQRFALGRHPAGIGSHPELRADLHAAYDGVRARMARDGSTPVIHPLALPDIALAFFLELEKDRVAVRLPEASRGRIAAVSNDVGLAKPLHLWFASASNRGSLATCTDVVARSGDLVVLSACADQP